MRLVFIGASKFGHRCLEKVISLTFCEVVGIITNKETFSISYNPDGVRNINYTNFSPVAENNNIPIFIMKDKMTDPQLIETIKRWSPDFILVIGWYHMVPKIIREIAPTAGMHASLLPDYSGGAPLVWAIINGEQRTGVTFFMFEDGVDSGDIIGQKTEPIYLNDTIATLYARVEEHGLSLLDEYLPQIAKKQVVLTQQDNKKRRIMPQRRPEDGEINWGWSAFEIYNFIRAQTKPYPGAFTFFANEKLIIWEAKIYDFYLKKFSHVPEGGTVLEVFDEMPLKGILVATPHNDSQLLLTKIGTNESELISGVEYAKRKKIRGGILGKSTSSKGCLNSGTSFVKM